MTREIIPAWGVLAIRHGIAEAIEVRAWKKQTVLRAVAHLGYADVISCRKLWPGINEHCRRRGINPPAPKGTA